MTVSTATACLTSEEAKSFMHKCLHYPSFRLIITGLVVLISGVIRPLPGSAETRLAAPLERCGWIADETARMRSYAPASQSIERNRPNAQGLGTWRFMRTPNARGGPDEISIVQTANPSRSDIDLAGLMLRCGDDGVDVLIVFIRPLAPRSRPSVKLTARGTPVAFDGLVIPPGVLISLPREATTLALGPWQSSPELALEVTENGNVIRGVVSLAGLAPALALLMSNCLSR
jgi:hypothetical protein